MRLLLDTHVVIWMFEEPKRVSPRITTMIKAAQNDVFVSAASAWEISIKATRGKLKFDPAFLDHFEDRLRQLAIEPLPVTMVHAVSGGRIVGPVADPFDRLLAAQAISEGLTIATVDPAIAALGAKVVW